MRSKIQYPVLLIMALLLGALASEARAQSAESLARQGNEYYKQGNYQKAVDAYRQATIRSPENSIFKYNLGTALAKAGDVEESQKVLTEAAEMQGAARRRDAYYNKGVTLGDAGIKGPEDAAAPTPAPTPGTPPQPGQDQAEMAQLQQRIDMLTQSLGAFRKNILTDPKDESAVYNYETVQAKLQRLREQMEEMKKNNQNQQNQGGQQQQQQKQNGGQNQNQQNGKGGQNGQNQQGQQQNQNNQGQGEGEQLKPEQIDANALLNLLEAEKPDQFKNLFKFRGGEKPTTPRKDW